MVALRIVVFPRVVTWLACLAVGMSTSTIAGTIVPVVCTVSGKADPGMDEAVCAEMLQQLSQTYANHTFQISESVQDGLSLYITMRNATKHGVGMQIKWQTPDGSKVAGEMLGFTVMDREATADMRAAFYRRVLAATPMPK